MAGLSGSLPSIQGRPRRVFIPKLLISKKKARCTECELVAGNRAKEVVN
jgi:hypothetical protein